ncbi:MAG: polysaccharide deacetylase family protein [Hyphomicrobiaceae bacterium]|nr:polysaccharide deacetylase family protein [Hyphomicrobiaceae bacterium]
MKSAIFNGIRALHVHTALRPPPERLAIYFHELEEHQWPAFAAAIKQLTGSGYRPTDPDTFVASTDGTGHLFVSFDDNYASWHRAMPLLAELGLTATFYVNTLPLAPGFSGETHRGFFDRIAHMGERKALSTSMLREIRARGHTIGCHTHSHLVLATLPRNRWDGEIARSKAMLEDILGEEIAHFSYPYGMRRFFSPALADYCRGLGFRTIATGIPGLQAGGPPARYALHRTRWNLSAPLARNLTDIRIDGRLFERLTGRSAIG